MMEGTDEKDEFLEGWKVGWDSVSDKPSIDEYIEDLQEWMDGAIERGHLSKERAYYLESEIFVILNEDAL